MSEQILETNRNKRILRVNEKTLNFYDYYITNALVIKFIDVDIKSLKKFFGKDIITGFDEIDPNTNQIIGSESFYLIPKHIFVKDTVIIEYENKIIKDAYDEEIKDPITGEITIIHHPAEVQTIEHEIPVELTTMTFEKPAASEEIAYMKNELKAMQDVFNTLTELPDINLLKACASLAKMNIQLLNDDEALEVKNLYPTWKELADENYISEKEEFKFVNEDILYKTLKPNQKFLSTCAPGEDTESIFTKIENAHNDVREV